MNNRRSSDHAVGLISLVGRSNVGKSTLINRILGRKVSAVSHRINTTLRSTANVHDDGPRRLIYVDTPGFDVQRKNTNSFRDTILNHKKDRGVIILMVDRANWDRREDLAVDQFKCLGCPVILVINKVDRMPEKWKLLPHIRSVGTKMNFNEVLPLCATRNADVSRLVDIVKRLVIPTRLDSTLWKIDFNSERFMITEIVRERLMRSFGDEIPYTSRIDVISHEVSDTTEDLEILISVESENQRKMMIGRRAAKIKKIGICARRSMERNFAKRINLNLRVGLKSKPAVRHTLRHHTEVWRSNPD